MPIYVPVGETRKPVYLVCACVCSNAMTRVTWLADLATAWKL